MKVINCLVALFIFIVVIGSTFAGYYVGRSSAFKECSTEVSDVREYAEQQVRELYTKTTDALQGCLRVTKDIPQICEEKFCNSWYEGRR